MSKICTKCNQEKELESFSKRKSSKDGLASWCRYCKSVYKKKYYQENKERLNECSKLYKENKERLNECSKLYKENNREEIKKYNQEYKSKNRERVNSKQRDYYKENRENILLKQREYREDNIEYYLNYSKNYGMGYRKSNKEKIKILHKKYRDSNSHVIAWRTILTNSLRNLNTDKESKTLEILGYSAVDLKLHMKSLFKEGMTWDNWGEWHIDHKYPLSKFDKNTPPHIVNSLNNLQPLWAFDNISKGNKIIEE